MAMWNPWRGCHKFSEGCKYCYIHKGDARRGVDTDVIVKADSLDRPIEKFKRGAHAGEYKIKPGETVYICFSSDFLLADADRWRGECWDIIRQRPDLNFLFLTKRIERFAQCAPPDWGEGWDNVIVGCTVENQAIADFRLGLFDSLPIRHKNIICQPLLEGVDLTSHLNGVELVVVGGESDKNARPFNFDWALDIRRQCVDAGVKFEYRQAGSKYIKDGVLTNVNPYQLCNRAKEANINT